jgi:hypothetical protein
MLPRNPAIMVILLTKKSLGLTTPKDIAKEVKKSKVAPLRSIEEHLGERRYSFYSLLTSALEGGERSASRPGRALHPGKEHWYPLYRRLGGPQSRSGRRE